MAARIRFNKNYNIGRVVSRIVSTILYLYVGGTVLTVFGNVMNGTASPFYDGLTLIGWTISDSVNGTTGDCNSHTAGANAGLDISNCITDTSGAGVLAVIGIIAIAGVVLEFVHLRM